jgi:hypothetical protein
MTATVTKAGPYYSSGSISFSSLRSNFKESASGSISASELRRNTTTTDTKPVVPDATENASVSTSSNLALSQFRNTIKYYYITQTDTNTNFDIDAQTWNSNLNKNIRKWMYINGTCGSNSSSSSAVDFNSTAYNLTIDVSGIIYGAGGTGGTSATISGGNGGNALSITNSSGSNLIVNVQSTAKIYGGGGGGEKGLKGADGSSGTCVIAQDFVSGCQQGGNSCPGGWNQVASGNWCCSWNRGCAANYWYKRCERTYAVSGGIGGEGGNGGPGRGYNNQSGALAGADGALGTSAGTCTSGGTYRITPGNGLKGENGGIGGEWAKSGGNTNNTGNGGSPGKAITGSNYTVTGTVDSTTIIGSYNPS